jgi:hypothetical protein
LKDFQEYEEIAKAKTEQLSLVRLTRIIPGQPGLIDGGVNLRWVQFEVNLFLLE